MPYNVNRANKTDQIKFDVKHININNNYKNTIKMVESGEEQKTNAPRVKDPEQAELELKMAKDI